MRPRATMAIALAALAAAAAGAGCGTDDVAPPFVQKIGAAPDAAPPAPPPPPPSPAQDAAPPDDASADAGVDAPPIDKPIPSSGPAFQTKSAAQLKNALIQCLGANVTQITAGMIQGTAGDAGPAQTAHFLTPGFHAGDDIVDVQEVAFDGDPAVLRSGTRADQMSITYLTALRNVANVAGARCQLGLSASPDMCACEAMDQATSMVERCMPYVDPANPLFTQVVTAFNQSCTTAGRGAAIASMVASSSFARFR